MTARSLRSRSATSRARSKRQTEESKGLEVHQCRVCLDAIPATFDHDHHEIPQAAGGQAGPQSSLCPTCHNSVHRIADMLMSGKASLAEDSAKIAYPDPKVRERLFALASTVTEWMTLKRDGKLDTDEPVSIMIELPPRVKLAAHMMAHDLRGSTGRRLGLATWIAALVKQEVYRRYPQLRPKGSP